MPAGALANPFDTAQFLAGVTAGERLSIFSAWGTALLAAAVAVVLFVLQDRRYRVYRREDRQQREAEQERERLREARAAARESWQREFEEIRGYQLQAEEVVDRILAQPNLSRSPSDDIGLTGLQLKYEAVARRCPDILRPPLRDVAEAVGKLSKITLPSNDEVEQAYRDAFASQQATQWPASVLGAKTIEHYCAAFDVRRAIDDVWRQLRTARGEE